MYILKEISLFPFPSQEVIVIKGSKILSITFNRDSDCPILSVLSDPLEKETESLQVVSLAKDMLIQKHLFEKGLKYISSGLVPGTNVLHHLFWGWTYNSSEER